MRKLQRRKSLRKKTTAVHSKSKIPFIVGCMVLLTIIGIFFIFESSSVSAFRELGDSFYFMKRQIINVIIASCVFIFFSLFDYKKIYFFSLPILIVTIVFLVLVLIPGLGTTVSGAQRWIVLGGFSFQPTELAKFAVILYLSSWFLYKEKGRMLSFIMLMGLILGLVMIQPDLGTTIILFMLFIFIYFFSGENIYYLIGLLPVSIGAAVFFVLTSPYRLNRVKAFLDPNSDPEGGSYHIRQILISLSSGGLIGRGFSSSRQKYQFLPEAHTDSIFAIIGEEIGFLGAFCIILLYCALLIVLYKAAQDVKDRYGSLLIASVFSIIGLQLIINLGGMVNLLPLTGVPLPFVSYGGSSLLSFYALMGIVVSVLRRNKL